MSSNEAKEQTSDISNLQESFSKQQKQISALKELVRKSGDAHGKSSSAQEKAKNIAQRLTHLKSRARARQSSTVNQPQHDISTASEAGDGRQQTMPSSSQVVLSQPQQQHLLMSPTASNISTPNPTPLKPQQRSESNTSLSGGTAGSEKILLLRQQMEQNKALIAQRASSKLHLEQLVTQLKEKFDTTQQCLEDTTELGKSMTDLSGLMLYTSAARERHRSATDLTSQPFSLEKERIKFLENRCRLLEKQLEKERQQGNSIREASLNESITSHASSKRIKELENKVVELEETLKEIQNKDAEDVQLDATAENECLLSEIAAKDSEIVKLREQAEWYETNQANLNDINYDSRDLVHENDRLLKELAEKLKRIAELEEVNDMLEMGHCEKTMKNNELEEQLHQLQTELSVSTENLKCIKEKLQQTENKCASLEGALETLQNTTEAIIVETNSYTDSQVKAEMAKQIQQLQDEIELLRQEKMELQSRITEGGKMEVSDIAIAEKIAALEATIESQREDLNSHMETLHRQEEELMEKTIELNVLNANFKVLEEKLQASCKNKPLFSSADGANEANNSELQTEIQQLKQKLDESNKAMIKLRLKCKQVEKQMEKLKKSSDLHAEIVRLEKTNEGLQQRITELEDEKGQWQLMQVEDTKMNTSAFAAVDFEEKCKKQAKTIRMLEEQKYENSDKLECTTSELAALQQKIKCLNSEELARVKSEMSEIHLEEQLKEQALQITSLQERIVLTEAEVDEYKQKYGEVQSQKQTLDKKLEHYIAENIELLDKVEKLSKSSSSAESIEIVERLTQQERAEIDEYNKILEDQQHTGEHAVSSVSELTQTEMGPELSESIAKLREESSELMNKIELFTTERREVLEKMEHLTMENTELLCKIDELTQQKEQLETDVLLAENTKSELEKKLQELSKERNLLASQVAESTSQKAQLSQELTSLQKSSEVVAALDCPEGVTLFEKCEKSLSKLNSELESYRKANDKNAKFNASKKLAKEAKNAYTQLSELLQKVKEASTAVETVTVVETVVAVTAPNGKALAEYEQLTAQNRELKSTVEELRRKLHGMYESNDDIRSDPTIEITEIVPAITQSQQAQEPELPGNHEKLEEALEKIIEYETQCTALQSTVEDLRIQLKKARLADEEKTLEICTLNEKLLSLRQISNDFVSLVNDKEISYEKQIEKFTRLRKELEGKCETYEGEMEILQTLVAEQKQQLIEAYKENEHEVTLKVLDLQQRDELITKLRAEVKDLNDTSVAVGDQLVQDLQTECDKLRESLRISKSLVTEQVNELSNKQETIDTLNQQIIELYKTVEDVANNVKEKEDEISHLQKLLDRNNSDLDRLRKDNNEQKSVVDKLLNELHSHRANTQLLPQLEVNLQRLQHENKELEITKKELEQRNKEQLEKLKKYAANLKKRTVQCQELEAKVKELEEKNTLEMLQSKEISQNYNDNVSSIPPERVKELEANIENSSKVLKQSLELKTAELLASVERCSQLEKELGKQQIAGKVTVTSSDWDEKDTSNNDKSARIVKLEVDLNQTQENLLLRTQENVELRNELKAVQLSDWGDSAKLIANKSRLEETEAMLDNLQAELVQMHEHENEIQQEKMELRMELKHKNELIDDLQPKVQKQEQQLFEIREELKAKTLKFEKSKAVIKERNNQIHRLQAQLKDLQDKLSSQPEEEHVEPPRLQPQLNASISETLSQQQQQPNYETIKQAYDQLNEKYDREKSNFEETVARLETLYDGLQAKLQEDMAYIETLEQDNGKFRDKICRLEECVASFEERRASMERRAHFLDSQMQSRADEYEKSEDELIYRLNMLSENDDVIAQRLIDSQEEKDELQQQVDRLQSERNNLRAKHSKLEKEYQAHKDQITANLEADNRVLREQKDNSESELQRIHAIYDAKLAARTTELDELECELTDQLGTINSEKRSLSEDLEKSRDECTALKDEIVRLKESLNAVEQSKHELERESTWLRMQNESSQQDQYELQELRMQSMQDKTELENARHQIETLASNHEAELQALRMQISELDTLRMQVGQNQTDDQVFIETENKRLTDLLSEKETIIENYQRQNLQLQMTAAATANAQSHQQQSDPFALAFGIPPPTPLPATTPATLTVTETLQVSQSYSADLERRERELNEKTELTARLQRDLSTLQAEFQKLLEANNEMQRQLAEKNRDIDNLRTASSHPPSQSEYINDVIPAPPMFFASEQTSSPFDEIIQARAVGHALEGAVVNRGRRDVGHNSDTVELPTIEDLQRNVSDLEKHAQDLENKLAMRNQREGESESRLRETQVLLNEAVDRVQERDQQLQRVQHELQEVKQKNLLGQNTLSVSQQSLDQVQKKLHELEKQLVDRDEKVKCFQTQLANFQKDKQQEPESQAHLDQLLSNIQRLEGHLSKRDNEVEKLKRELQAEKQLHTNVLALENQIIPVSIANTQVDGSKEPIPTLDMFFGGSSAASDFETLGIPQVSSEPVVEEVIVPKKAYICEPDADDSNATTAGFDLGGDWGDSWGGQEIAEEAGHFANFAATTGDVQQSLVPREQRLEIQLQEETERIQELQLALERCEQQKQELHVKSGKLMKKLKEYKTKNNELQAALNSSAFRKSTSVESSSIFDDLDVAIQEELKTQIRILEAKLEEEHNQQENHAIEKEKLLKRIDVLTAGNDRMSEMKERQDMDVQMYQARIRELQDKLNKLEDWGEGEEIIRKIFAPPAPQASIIHIEDPLRDSMKHQLEQKISELTAEIQDITADRQELQALLEEEKSNLLRTEDTVRTLKEKISSLDAAAMRESSEKSKINQIKLEHQNLREEYNILLTTYEHLTEELQNTKVEHEKDTQVLQCDAMNLKAKLLNSESALEELQKDTQKLRDAATRNEEQFGELQLQLVELRARNEELQQANSEIERSASSPSNLELQLQATMSENAQLHRQKESLEKEMSDLKIEIKQLHTTILTTSTTNDIGTTTSAFEGATNNDELAVQLQEKEAEIMHLKQRIEDLMREDQTEKLVLEILTKNQEIHMLKMQVKHLEDDKHELEHNLSVQLTQKIQEGKSETGVENNQLRDQVRSLKSQLQELNEEKRNMEEELKVLNNHVLSNLDMEDKLKATALEIDIKNIEIAELRKSVETVTANATDATSNTNAPPVDFIALNAQWELIVEQKCGEIAQMWREHLEAREREFKEIESRLQEQVAALRTTASEATEPKRQQQTFPAVETPATSTPASESTSPSGTSSAIASKDSTPFRTRIRNEEDENEAEADAIIEKMQAALESQEMEIVTLKEQLAIRSAEYARLAAQYDPFKLHTTLSHSGMTTSVGPVSLDSSQTRRNASTGDNTVVPKSELDLALYMLHQRDMRCEEMTLELVSLLEERDTLQLKLSNTLRQVEAIKVQTCNVEPLTTQTSSVSTSDFAFSSINSPLKSAVAGTTARDSVDELNQKLSQLQYVDHSKDKVIKEEREQRNRQMEKIQQDVAKMPTAAVSELVGADISQSNQSPSTVLLNWLWGNPNSTGSGTLPN